MKYFIGCLFILSIFTGCLEDRTKSVKSLQDSQIEVNFKKTKGDVFNISLKNKQVLVLNFFTTSCGACKEEFGSLNALDKEFSGKIKILGILGEKVVPSEAKEFIKKYKIAYDVILNPSSVKLFSDAVGKIFGVPVTFIFDKDGNLKGKFLGYVPHATLRKALLKAI